MSFQDSEEDSVLDRTKDPVHLEKNPFIWDFLKPLAMLRTNFDCWGRYGLGSKDTTPSQIITVYKNLKQENTKNNFTMGLSSRIPYSLPEKKSLTPPRKER
jgi:pyruvate-ferredoxin/flavodoxin oxidoreductase